MDPTDRGAASVLTVRRVLAARREAVFAAWTDAGSLRQWMCPEHGSVLLAELDVRVGGAFRIEMLASGERLVHTGTYREVRPPERLVFTWASKHTQQRDTLVTVELRALGDGTELTLTHTLLPDDIAFERHSNAWMRLLGQLDDQFRPGEAGSTTPSPRE